MRNRTERESDWFFARVGLLRLVALAVVTVAIVAIVGMVLFGVIGNNVR